MPILIANLMSRSRYRWEAVELPPAGPARLVMVGGHASAAEGAAAAAPMLHWPRATRPPFLLGAPRSADTSARGARGVRARRS
jgi:hypothetical protein